MKRSSWGSPLVVLGGLIAGIVLGTVASRSGSPLLLSIISGLEPVGTLFMNGIRMAVVPLVVASLITGIASMTDVRSLTRLGLRSFVLFVALTLTAAIATTVLAVPLLAQLDIGPLTVQALRQASMSRGGAIVAAPPGLGQWISDLVPANPIKAAADGSMLPLIVFTLGFGLALTRIPPDRRAAVVGFFGGLSDAMMVLVGWIINLAPVGVFALAAPLATRMGMGTAGALLGYVSIAVLLTVVVVAFLVYPAAAFLSRMSIARLARASAPAQAVAFSTRSTMASLPAMVQATKALGVPGHVVAFVVPLAAAMLRVGSAVGQMVAVLFAARLFDVSFSAIQLIAIVLTTVLTTFTVPGIPGGSIVVMVPILMAANVPTEALGLLLGVDVIPDMFRTMANVTGGILASAILGRSMRQEEFEPLLSPAHES